MGPRRRGTAPAKLCVAAVGLFALVTSLRAFEPLPGPQPPRLGRRAERRSHLTRASLNYAEAGSSRWSRKVLCVVRGDKLYMFKRVAVVDSGLRGRATYVLCNHPLYHLPDYSVVGPRNVAYVDFPRSVVVETAAGRKRFLDFRPGTDKPNIASIDLGAQSVTLRNGVQVKLVQFRLPRKVIITRRTDHAGDNVYGGATRHLYPHFHDYVELGDEVSLVFWRCYADDIAAIAGRTVDQDFARPWEFTIGPGVSDSP